MEPTNKLLQLVETLINRTTAGKANWSQGSQDDTFLWSTTSGSVAVFPKDHDNQPPYVLRVLGSQGEVLEEEVFFGGYEGFDAVVALFKVARRNALDIDSMISNFLGEHG